MRIVAEDGSVVTPGSGVVGEVQCRGPTVFDGYWNNPEATAKSFADDGNTDSPASSWFRTGDLATLNARGYLSVVDRKTDMVLVGGENVYTAEVEAALHSHPAVKQAAVFGVDNEILGQMVHAAVVLRTKHHISSQELVGHARGLLSAYKVPAVLQVVDSLPTGGSGKVLKTKLREMAVSSGVKSAANRESAEATQKQPTCSSEISAFPAATAHDCIYGIEWVPVDCPAKEGDGRRVRVNAPSAMFDTFTSTSTTTTAAKMARITRDLLAQIEEGLTTPGVHGVDIVSRLSLIHI